MCISKGFISTTSAQEQLSELWLVPVHSVMQNSLVVFVLCVDVIQSRNLHEVTRVFVFQISGSLL